MIATARISCAGNRTTGGHHAAAPASGVDERYLILQGTGLVRVGEMTSYKVGPGAVVIIPEGTPQQISNVGDTDLVFYCVCTPRFSPDCYESLE